MMAVKGLNADELISMRQMRWLGWTVMVSQRGTQGEHGIPSAEYLMELPGDDEIKKKRPRIRREDYDEIFKMFGRE